MHKPNPPKNQAILLSRAHAIAGQTVEQIAELYGIAIPNTLRRSKGFIGQMLEYALGANADNQAKPDFQDLNIELKTLPLNNNGHPRESTYVCSIPSNLKNYETFEHSWLRQKLNHVLWVPVQGEPSIPIHKRLIGTPFLWQPSTAITAVLKKDFDELMEMLSLGKLETLTAHHGNYLQIRPKAANSRVLFSKINSDGYPTYTVPKGFYLKTRFTKMIIENTFPK